MSDNNQKPDAWGQNKKIPDSWGKNNKLPENWGKQSKAFAADASDISSSNNDDKPDIGNELSEIANACGKTLLGAAREVSDAAKSAAGSVVEYAKSDEAKKKINAVKDKAKFIAAVADCAVTDTKEKTSDKINEFRQSRAGKAVTGNNVSGDGIDDIYSEDKNTKSEYQEIPYIPTEPASVAAVINDTETKNEAVSLENVSYEEHTDIVVSTTKESRQDNITPVNATDSTETAKKVTGRIATYTSSSGRIFLSEEAADLDTKISYLKKEKSLKEHEFKNTSAMSANKRELKNEVDDYSQVLSSGLSELHSVNASDVLKYCSAEDIVGKTISYGSLNGDFIEWTIIENTGSSVTMLSNEVVFHSPFDVSDDPSIVYKNSYIRQLLNAPQFMTQFFSLEEAVHITGISLPKQKDIAMVSNPDLNESYWLLSFSNRGDETPIAINAYGNIIGESTSKNLGVRLKLKISPDVNYDIIKVYEEQENNPPKAGLDIKKILTIAGGAVAAISLIVGGVFIGSKLIHKSSSDNSSKNDDIVVSDVLNGNTNDTNENAVHSGAEITPDAVTELDATSDSAGENASVTGEQTSPAITGRKLQFYPSDKIKDYPVYLEKLKDLKTNGIYREQNNGFFLCDINEDNVPELFATFDTEDQGILFAGSVYSGELVPFAEFMGADPLRGITLFNNGAIGITSAGNEGHGISYTLYDGGNLLNGQHESISYIYENGSLSYISYQNDSQEKHITEAEVEQIQKKYVEASYSVTSLSSVIDTVKLPDNSKYIGEGYVITESSDLNMRSEPNSSSKVIASIPKNTKIDCYESGTIGWYITYYKGDTGYVSSEFVSIGSNGSSTVINGITVYTCSKKGRINTHGGNLPSITLDYITGGEWQTLRDSLGNGWHIKATRYCNAMGITWYEIVDSDDGDYYGWIDGEFIDFD